MNPIVTPGVVRLTRILAVTGLDAEAIGDLAPRVTIRQGRGQEGSLSTHDTPLVAPPPIMPANNPRSQTSIPCERNALT